MVRSILLSFCLILGFQHVANAQSLRAELAMAEFHSLDGKPFLETYLKLKGNSLILIPSNDGLLSEVILEYLLVNVKDTLFRDKFKLSGPVLENDSSLLDFIDVQRIPLSRGENKLLIRLKDPHRANDPDVVIEQVIESDLIRKEASISGIQLVDEFSKTSEQSILTKSGFNLIPYTSNFFGQERDELSFYVECYYRRSKFQWGALVVASIFNPAIALPEILEKSIKENEGNVRFLFDMFIENAENGNIVADLRNFKRHPGSLAVPTLHTFPLKDVPTGNYNLVLEVKDTKNEVLDRRTFFFQRYNELETSESDLSYVETIYDVYDGTFVDQYRPEELKEYLRCLHPISNQAEITFVNRDIRKGFNNVDEMKKFLYNFWKVRNPENPEKAWLEYLEEVKKVNASYSTNLKKGYDTDRGRVYLQYGPPNTITPSYFEPNTYPYEIWHYYQLKDRTGVDQANRKFVFANMEGATKEFDLIHSDAKNEITNARWHHDLHNRSSQSINLDVEDAGGHYGGRSRDFFENPY